jgi:hypothetical protein
MVLDLPKVSDQPGMIFPRFRGERSTNDPPITRRSAIPGMTGGLSVSAALESGIDLLDDYP